MEEVKQKKILIVDDDSGDLEWLKRIINTGYEVLEANNGTRAIEIVNREHPDLVLMDVMMPKVSGYSVCARLKRNPDTKDIPVVMVTGLGTEMNMKIGRKMGATGYLVKPIKPDQLRDVFNKYLT
jgi:putative two-component system response regulator